MYKFSTKSLPLTFQYYFKNMKYLLDRDNRKSVQKDYFLTLHIPHVYIDLLNYSVKSMEFNFISYYKKHLIKNYN